MIRRINWPIFIAFILIGAILAVGASKAVFKTDKPVTPEKTTMSEDLTSDFERVTSSSDADDNNEVSSATSKSSTKSAEDGSATSSTRTSSSRTNTSRTNTSRTASTTRSTGSTTHSTTGSTSATQTTHSTTHSTTHATVTTVPDVSGPVIEG